MDTPSRRPKPDTSPEARKAQHKIYRQMDPARKFELIFETYQTGRQLATTGIRMRNPHANDEEIWHLWARQHLGADTYDQAYGAIDP